MFRDVVASVNGHRGAVNARMAELAIAVFLPYRLCRTR